jgi:hypothetical protein
MDRGRRWFERGGLWFVTNLKGLSSRWCLNSSAEEGGCLAEDPGIRAFEKENTQME